VAHNIILNAIEAAPATGGRVNISTRYDPGKYQPSEPGAEATGRRMEARVTFSIGDNGPGIPPEERDRIFDAFHSSKGHGGTGLGLAAAKKIVSELHGAIEVESVVGEGTTFHVKLPAVHVRLADSDKTHGPGPH